MKMILKLLLPIFVIYNLYILYSGAADIWFYDKIKIWVPAIIILLIIPLCLFISFNLWLNSAKGRLYSYLILFLSILVHVPFFGYWIGQHETAIYKKFGVKTKAVIIRSFYDYDDGPRMYYQFKVGTKVFTSFNEYNKQRNMDGDTIEIIYNKDNPEMNKAEVHLEK